MSAIKNTIKKGLELLPFTLTKNMEYDRQTLKVLKKVLNSDSNCIDIGCHKGEVLDLILNYAPKGEHIGFEPIPTFYNKLKEKYPSNCSFYNIALSDTEGSISFNYVKTNPAYSGIKQRSYANNNEEIEIIKVETKKLDDILNNYKPDFIKIDVEGAELQVLKGAINTLTKYKPIVVFEHGLGAADHYGTKPKQIYNLFNDCGMKLNTMKNWLKGIKGFNLEEFEEQFNKRKNYYFIAYP